MSAAPRDVRPTEARVFAGLDEAGYGPLLGPLTYGYSVFRCARGEPPHWARLVSAVTRERRGSAARLGVADPPLIVADSKQVFDRTPRGHMRLEATALAFLAASPRGAPRSGREMLEACPPGLAPDPADLAQHPWYDDLPATLPAHVTSATLTEHSARLTAALAHAALEVAEAGARVVPVGALNRAFARFGNKATAHMALGGDLCVALFERFGAEGLDLTCDRLGGRKRYGAELAGLFPWAEQRTLREESSWSEYDLCQGERRMRIRFVEKGDREHFAVALGSCLAKYARELVMGAFNTHFARLDPSLAPTAGYVQDGRRWLAEAEGACVGLDRRVLVRTR